MAGAARISAKLFAAVVAMALLLFLSPIPTDSQLAALAFHVARAPPGAVLVVGNSVIDHVSGCDNDRRTLPQMLAADLGRPVIDASFGGQDLSTSLGLAAIAIRRSKVAAVVFPVTAQTLSISDRLGWHDRAFFRLAGGAYASFGLVNGSARQRQPDFYGPFRYKGRDYPGYDGLKHGHLAAARRTVGCPETLGPDVVTTEAMYWHGSLSSPLNQARLRDLKTLSHDAQVRGKRLILVAMPFPREDVAAMDPRLLQAITMRSGEMLAGLAQPAAQPLDLFGAVPTANFADRWCACGHLQAGGRAIVARAVAQRLR